MATSGVTTFSVTRDDIIYLALEDIKAYAPDFETPPPSAITRVNKRLNLMIKAWQAAGVGLWLNLIVTLPLADGEEYYSLGPSGDHCSSAMGETAIATAASSGDLTITVDDASTVTTGQFIGIELDDGTIQWTTVNGVPVGNVITLTAALTDDVAVDNVVFFYTTKISRPIGIVEARCRDASGNDLPMTSISWDEYTSLPLKSSSGKVTQYCFKPDTVNSKLYVWPTGDDISDRIVMTIRTPVQDFVNTDDTPDFPIEWADALHYSLAMRLIPIYDVPQKIAADIKQLAAITLQDADNFDREQNVSIQFGVADY